MKGKPDNLINDGYISENILIHIKPFRGLRPNKDLCSKIVSLPYDILSSEEIKKIVADNPYSLYRIIRSEVEFDNIDPYSDDVYKKARENLEAFISKGYLIRDNEPCFYIYREIAGEFQQTGLIGNILSDDFEDNTIKKHENTRIEKVSDRTKHIERVNAQTGLVFLACRSQEELTKILEDNTRGIPEYDFKTDDSIRHIFWKICENKVTDDIIKIFNDIKNLYIADGHHRVNAAINVCREQNARGGTEEKEDNYILSIIYPHDCLRILPYNRAIKKTNLTIAEIEDIIKNDFNVEEVKPTDNNKGFSPNGQREIGMYFKGKWYRLISRKSIISDDPVLSLDASVLQEYILYPVFGIRDPRVDENIDFIGGNKDTAYLEEIVDSGEYDVAFSLFPTSIEQLFAVADMDKLMPPKSTWFEPKPRSGFTIHLLDP